MSFNSTPATSFATVTLPGLDDLEVGAPRDGGSDRGIAGDPDLVEERRACMERAGKLLATRARSERELSDRLAAAGFEPEWVTRTIERLRELGLVDDADFARRWIEERSGRKGLGPAKLRAELVAKGVDGAVVDEALAEAGLDEEGQATALAASLVWKVARKPLQAQASALWQMLRRKGYSSEACEVAVKAVMPPEGWD
jgi:regulatory protein